MKKKQVKKSAKTKENQPIHVALPNTTREKMEAICTLARTVEHLALLLSSVNVKVYLIGCEASNCSGDGIRIDVPESA